MRKIRFAKVRITQPPGVAAKQPLERPPARPGAAARPSVGTSLGLDQWERTEKAMQREHDRNLAGYSRETAEAALKDLAPRRTNEKGNPEQRWIRHRRAALMRKLHAPELVG